LYLGIDAGNARADLEQTRSSASLPLFSGEQRSRDSSDLAFGIHLGYEFSEHFGIELGYLDAGTSEFRVERQVQVGMLPDPISIPNFDLIDPGLIDFDAPPVSIFMPADFESAEPFFTRHEVRFDTKIVSLSIRGRYEFARSVGLFAGAGIADHFVDARGRVWLGTMAPLIEHDSQHVLGARLSAGVDWSFHPHWSWRLKYEYHVGATTDEFELVERGDVQALTTGLSYRF
jgi:opacity protein-like surface antigen